MAIAKARERITIDRQTGYLAGLFVLVELAAIWLARDLVAAGAAEKTAINGQEASASEAAGAGAAWVGLEVGLAVAVLAAILLYRRFPEPIQQALKLSAVAVIFLHLGGQWGQAGVLIQGAGLTVGIVMLWGVADALDVWWLCNNVLGIGIAIAIGAILPLYFGVWGLLVGLLGLTLYDHYFANKRDWMFDIAGALLKARLPLVVFKPPRLRFDWDLLFDEEAETPDSAWGIGVADLALPAGFAAAVAVAPADGIVAGGALAAAGVVVGSLVAVARLRYEMLTRGSGAGLPPLTAGAVGGFMLTQLALVVA